MRTFKKANIVYFTGTGSTGYAAETLADNLKKRGIEVQNKSISVYDDTVLTPSDILFFLYPVHAGDASEAVYKYIKTLDNVPVPMTDSVVISISAGGEAILNTAARSKVIRKLMKKGFRTVYEDMVVMPNNFVTSYTDDLNGLLIKALPVKINKIVDDIIEEKIQRKSPKLIDSVLRTVCEPFKVYANFNGKFLKADEKCIGCGICEKCCPTGNIKIIDKKPQFDWDCVLCMKCVYLCPEGAIGNITARAIKIKGGYDIKVMKKLSENIELTKDNIIRATPSKTEYAVQKYLLEVEEIKNNVKVD